MDPSEIERTYNTADSVLLSLFMRTNGKCNIYSNASSTGLSCNLAHCIHQHCMVMSRPTVTYQQCSEQFDRQEIIVTYESTDPV